MTSSLGKKVGWSILAVIVILALTALPAAAQRAAPTNYCTTVTATPTGSTYTVDATGAGRYARVVEYPVTGAAVVVAGPTDFGVGATAYHWTNVPLGQRQYQVQISHTSLTTGFSTTGCVFTPPVPQAVVLSFFDAKPMDAHSVHLVWATETEIGVAGFYLYAETEETGEELLAFVPSSAPGSGVGAFYAYFDTDALAGATITYTLYGVALNGGAQYLDAVHVITPR